MSFVARFFAGETEEEAQGNFAKSWLSNERRSLQYPDRHTPRFYSIEVKPALSLNRHRYVL